MSKKEIVDEIVAEKNKIKKLGLLMSDNTFGMKVAKAQELSTLREVLPVAKAMFLEIETMRLNERGKFVKFKDKYRNEKHKFLDMLGAKIKEVEK